MYRSLFPRDLFAELDRLPPARHHVHQRLPADARSRWSPEAGHFRRRRPPHERQGLRHLARRGGATPEIETRAEESNATETAQLWSAVTCHRFPQATCRRRMWRGDRFETKRFVQVVPRAAGRSAARPTSRPSGKSGDKSPHSKALRVLFHHPAISARFPSSIQYKLPRHERSTSTAFAPALSVRGRSRSCASTGSKVRRMA